ncbi:unnamed protein product [Ambrosiozyma monospora]|uniref:Unnamed protein product n=1 Tax=Ambrosiozyma monospora TaxID=43982 RepID=A0A9W7DI43_AMBMO|nr:unnamed protein product [Ambrosiozyma monospora]
MGDSNTPFDIVTFNVQKLTSLIKFDLLFSNLFNPAPPSILGLTELDVPGDKTDTMIDSFKQQGYTFFTPLHHDEHHSWPEFDLHSSFQGKPVSMLTRFVTSLPSRTLGMMHQRRLCWEANWFDDTLVTETTQLLGFEDAYFIFSENLEQVQQNEKDSYPKKGEAKKIRLL